MSAHHVAAPARAWRPQALIGLAVLASAVAGVGLGAGAPLVVLGGLVALVAAWGVRVLLHRGRETTLLALAGTSLAPMPQALRVGLLVATIGLVIGVALTDRLWPTEDTRRLGRPQLAVLAGLLVLDLSLVASSVLSGHTGPLPGFAVAAAVSLSFTWALYRRAQVVGPLPIAIGVAAASAIASAIVLLRLGGLPLIGSANAGDYADAKSVVVDELGDVNGQALIVMLGLPFLLAFALHAKDRLAALAAAFATGLCALALLVLLSRSSLVGAIAGVALVTLLMARLSRGRVALVCLIALGGGIFFASGVERISADDKNLGTRSVLWKTALDFWHQNPLLGHGPNSWPRLVSEQVRWAPTEGRGGTHNVLLSGLVSGGVIAAGLLLILIAAVAYLGIRNLRRLRGPGSSWAYVAVVGAMGAFMAQVVRGLFEATGWPGTRPNDLRTWSGLLLVAIVVIITTTAVPKHEPGDGPPGEPMP